MYTVIKLNRKLWRNVLTGRVCVKCVSNFLIWKTSFFFLLSILIFARCAQYTRTVCDVIIFFLFKSGRARGRSSERRRESSWEKWPALVGLVAWPWQVHFGSRIDHFLLCISRFFRPTYYNRPLSPLCV